MSGVVGRRALGRATLARQLLLERAEMGAEVAVAHLLGLQAQNVKPPYFQLWSRLAGFRPEELSELMESRRVVRMVTMRSTIHTHTAADALRLGPLVQPARDREIQHFGKGLVGVDLARLKRISRELVEAEPRTMAQLRAELAKLWPAADPQALAVAARCSLLLVQVTPRGLWERSGQVRLTTLENWTGLGERAGHARGIKRGAGAGAGVPAGRGAAAGPGPLPGAEPPAGPGTPPGTPPGTESTPATPLEDTVLRYLRAFGPASVKDMQTWAGLTRLREVFEGLRERLVVLRGEDGAELFDLPEAPRPDEDVPAPVRFLPEFDNLLLSHADRTRIIPPEVKGRTWSGNQAHCTFLVDGQLAGIWRLGRDKDGGGERAELVVEAFGALTRAHRTELAEEGERMLREMTTAERFSVRFGPLK